MSKIYWKLFKKKQKLHILIKKIVNIYIAHELGASTSHVEDPTLKNCLFGAVTLTKNADIDSIGIQVMELGLIEKEVFHFQVVDLVKM